MGRVRVYLFVESFVDFVMSDLQKTMLSQLADKSLFKTAQEFGHDYLDGIAERRVYPDAAALQAMKGFNEALPDTPQDAEDIIAQLHRLGSPATTAQMGPRYFGFVNGGVIPVGLASKLVADFWDQNGALNVISPIVSALETVCEGWLRDLFGLPENVVAGFVSGSSLAILSGLAAGRYRIFHNHGWDVNKQGLAGAPRIRIIASEQCHATVVKAVALLGLGTDHIEWVAADAQGRIDASLVPQLDDRCLLVLQAGNVNSGAFDDFNTLCQAARQAGAWVHIDGAFGLWAMTSTELRGLTLGAELAHSWSVDGHKTLNTPYDCGIALCADREALMGALQASGSYIVYSEQRDGMLYTPEMSRRARAVELWAILKFLGRSGVDDLVTRLHHHSLLMRDQLAAHFTVHNDVVFNQLMVSAGSDERTVAILQRVQEEGVCWAGGAIWQGQRVIRISVCSWRTRAEDIRLSADSFIRAAIAESA